MTTKKRQSKPVVKTELSQEEINTLLNTYAKADANLEKISAQIDLEVLKIAEKHKDKIAELKTQKDEAYDQLKGFYEAKKEEFFTAKKKSIDTLFGRVGFQKGQPAASKLKGYTWEACTKLLKHFLPTYVRTKEEVNKEQLILDRDNHIPDELCTVEMKEIELEKRPLISSLYAQCGVEITQGENFFIELKKEEVSA